MEGEAGSKGGKERGRDRNVERGVYREGEGRGSEIERKSGV